MNDAQRGGYAEIDITPWAGVTPDEMLALGAREYPLDRAKAIVQFFAEVSTSLDLDRFMTGFTDNAVLSFNDTADIAGQAAIRQYMAPRFAHFARPGSGFLCRKQLRALNGNLFGVVWVNHWRDPESGHEMRSKGLEYWMMDDSRITRWDAAFNAWAIKPE